MGKSILGSRWVRVMLIIATLWAIVWLVDIDRTWSILKGTEFQWLGLAFLVVQLQIVLSAVRWRQTANRLGLRLSIRRAVSEYYLATVANLSLPGGVSGDAARVYRNRCAAGWQQTVLSVTIERLAGQVALLVVTLAGWVLWPVFMHQRAPASLMQVLFLTLALITVVIVCVRVVGRFSRIVARFAKSFGPALQTAWLSDGQWLSQSLLSLMIVATYICVFAISAIALSQPIPLIALITVVPVVLLSMVIPVSIGGWGVRELVAASLWPLVGLSAEAGIASSIVYGLVSLLSLLPVAVYFVLVKPRS